jgi:hypothetical protein
MLYTYICTQCVCVREREREKTRNVGPEGVGRGETFLCGIVRTVCCARGSKIERIKKKKKYVSKDRSHSKAREKSRIYSTERKTFRRKTCTYPCWGAFYIIGKYKMIEKAGEGYGDKIPGYAPNKKEIKIYSTRLSLLKNSFILYNIVFASTYSVRALRRFIRFWEIRIVKYKNIYTKCTFFCKFSIIATQVG